jgi:hypothetical protein
MNSSNDLEALINRAISFFNRTHSPNAVAKLILFSPTLITVQFSGVFCIGCGTMEITEAFADHTKLLSQGKTTLKHDKTIQISPHAIQAVYSVRTKIE